MLFFFGSNDWITNYENRGMQSMVSKSKKAFTLLTTLVLITTVLLSACSKTENTPKPTNNNTNTENTEQTSNNDQPSGEPTVIVFGTHWQPGDDPSWTDPVTGEPGMPPDQLAARKAAEEAVLNELNVKIEWKQYPEDIRDSLLTSVLPDQPIVDIAVLWGGGQGTLLGQNIVRRVDQYCDTFAGPAHAWMFGNRMFGGVYFLSSFREFVPQWPLGYNIDYPD